jgi:glycosyltransferase involved in cell wall biosynthesis
VKTAAVGKNRGHRSEHSTDRACSVCLVATIPFSLAMFMAAHVQSIRDTYNITLVANGSPDVLAPLLGRSVSFRRIGIARRVAIFRDMTSLVSLWILFRRGRFQIVHSITPKAGLLSMIAARMAGVPIRVHWFTGQVWATRTGIRRRVLKAMDRLLIGCATHVLVDSPSQAAFLVNEGIMHRAEALVLGHGSVCGVDTERFRPDATARLRVRTRLGIDDSAVVALYLGRLNCEKGLPELGEAFAVAARLVPDLYLLVVGPDEQEMAKRIRNSLGDVASRARFIDFTSEPEAYMAASDIFVLPSHREGFGMSVIEAASCEIPTIGTRIYGLSDALIDGRSGLLVPVNDPSALADAIVRLANNPEMRIEMGRAARRHVERHFTQAHLTTALSNFYRHLLETGDVTEPSVKTESCDTTS